MVLECLKRDTVITAQHAADLKTCTERAAWPLNCSDPHRQSGTDSAQQYEQESAGVVFLGTHAARSATHAPPGAAQRALGIARAATLLHAVRVAQHGPRMAST